MRYKVQGTRFNVKRSTFNVERVHRCTGALVHRNFFSTFHLPLSTIWKAALLVTLAAFQLSCSDPPLSRSPSPPLQPEQAQPARIVSLAPSITEVLFELGLSDRVAGVTRYCDYPPEVMGKPVVGGYFDVNYEMLLSLEPNLVILLAEHVDARARLADLGFDTLTVNHSRVSGILESITTIADRCGTPKEGKTLRGKLEGRIDNVRDRLLSKSLSHSVSQSKPRVLVAVGRLLEKSSGGEIFISGRDGFYDDLIVLAGGVNAYREETLKFPAISDEGLIRIDPDVILEMVPDLTGMEETVALLDLWNAKSGVRAVREGRVYILGEDYVVVPGPRFIYLLEDIAEIIKSTRPFDKAQGPEPVEGYPVPSTQSGGTVVKQ